MIYHSERNTERGVQDRVHGITAVSLDVEDHVVAVNGTLK